MEARKIDPSQALSWYADGWRLFVKDPGLWVLLSFFFLAISSAAMILIPLLGPAAIAVLFPAFYAGLLRGARESLGGGKPRLNHLFAALADPDRRGPLLMLGVLALGAQAIMLGLATVLGLPDLLVLTPGRVPAVNLEGGAIFGLVVRLVFVALIYMALLYGTPLVFFDKLDPITAIKSSFSACWRNIAPLTISGLIYLGLAAIASLIFFLGFLILIPVTLGAVYSSYRAIFDAKEASDILVIE